jgi:hypothetical protein
VGEQVVRLDEVLPRRSKAGENVRVTARRLQALDLLRPALIDAARERRTVTYGEAAEMAGGLYLPRGMGALLDVLAIDCERRGEPRLDSLVVTRGTGEVGEGFDGHAARDRQACWQFWPGTVA